MESDITAARICKVETGASGAGDAPSICVALLNSSHQAPCHRLFLNGLFASKNGLNLNDEVLVEVLPKLPKCFQVDVEPLSADDWEIVFLNASLIEWTLLDQVQIAELGLVFPFWINGVCIFLRISSMSPERGILSVGTEVHVLSNVSPAPCPKLKEAEEEQIDPEEAELSPPPSSCLDAFVETVAEALESALCVEAPAHLLLSGPQTSGKSWLALQILQRLQRSRSIAFHVLHCRQLKGKKVETVEKRLKGLLEEVEKEGGGVLLLDDLDALCPSDSGLESLSPGNNILTAKLAKTLINQVNCGRRRGGVGILGTGRSVAALHPFLVSARGTRFFRQFYSIPALDSENRGRILKQLMELEGLGGELEAVVAQTEGSVVGDLMRLLHGARLAAAIRCPGDDARRRLTESDFGTALVDFEPLNLHGANLNRDSTDVAWEDVGGLRRVKQILTETFIWPVEYPELLKKSGVEGARGALLHGPSGTGKTLLAGALASTSRLNFISIKGPELLSKYIGASEQAVRDVFSRARSARPCLVFFDEFESLAPRRGHDSTGVTDRVVNQLLTELDGVEALEGVLVLCASSRPDLLDPALLRPGRIQKHLYCGFPNLEERLEILKILTRSLSLKSDVDLGLLVESTDGWSGADLKAMVSDARIRAFRRRTGRNEDSAVGAGDLAEALREKPQTTPVSGLPQDLLNLIQKTVEVPVGERATLA